MAEQVLIENLCFGEGPRWHDSALWLSDMHDRKVLRVTADGRAETVVELQDDEPSGLGWLPDGDLLIVSMRKRQLLRFDGQRLTVHADLSDLASWHCNDMVVDATGRAYVGNFGFDLHNDAPPGPAELIRQEENGEVTHRIELDRGAFACMIGGANLYVLTAFSSHPDQCRANRDARVEVYPPPYRAAGWP